MRFLGQWFAICHLRLGALGKEAGLIRLFAIWGGAPPGVAWPFFVICEIAVHMRTTILTFSPGWR